MLTRLKVEGFKNLDGVDVRFGPFTCVAGANGVGKSNLFDAIAFLSALADKPLVEAAASVRGAGGRVSDLRSIFRNDGPSNSREMSFLAEMIIPEEGVDDLGSATKASMTFLKYHLRLRLRPESSTLGPLEVVSESMDYIPQSQAGAALRFPHTVAWRTSVVRGKRNVPYIETWVGDDRPVVVTRADSAGAKGGGRPREIVATSMPRTVLSSANNAAEYRTLVLARKEMMSWSEVQLEPSALRQPDEPHTPPGVGRDGAHLAATLRSLIREAELRGDAGGESLRSNLSNRLAGLIREVRDLRVDVDERRNTVTLIMRDLSGADYAASQLSDGTLRFIAIALLQADYRGPGVLCFEEPENGIHPRRIRAMLDLFGDYAVDVDVPVGAENPLRQVIVNTHSPIVVGEVSDDALLLAVPPGVFRPGPTAPRVVFRPLTRTWRTKSEPEQPTVGRTELLDYLVSPGKHEPGERDRVGHRNTRVADRAEFQTQLFPDNRADKR